VERIEESVWRVKFFPPYVRHCAYPLKPNLIFKKKIKDFNNRSIIYFLKTNKKIPAKWQGS
ncbi:hypothetical protein J4U37_10500, partial [Escherichia coli]